MDRWRRLLLLQAEAILQRQVQGEQKKDRPGSEETHSWCDEEKSKHSGCYEDYRRDAEKNQEIEEDIKWRKE